LGREEQTLAAHRIANTENKEVTVIPETPTRAQVTHEKTSKRPASTDEESRYVENDKRNPLNKNKKRAITYSVQTENRFKCLNDDNNG